MFNVTADPEPVESKGRGRPLGSTSFAERDRDIIAKYQGGQTCGTIAEEYGITRERVCQILRRVNIIEHVKERKREAREVLAREVTEVRAKAKADVQAKVDAALQLVRDGRSHAEATLDVGLPMNAASLVSRAAKSNGIPLRHSRWRDFSARKARVRQMLDDGASVLGIVKQLRAEGDVVYYEWVRRHFPEVRGRKRGRQPRKPRPTSNPEAQWTDEIVALLRKQWLAGSSAQHISDMLGGGFTRNAIIGKVNRLRAAGKLFV